MKRLVCSAIVAALCVAASARADSILYESATNGGGTNDGGVGILFNQFLASEFTLSSAATITNIIGQVQWFGNSQIPNNFFMTLLQLSGPGIPNNLVGDPFGGTTQLYTTTFSAAPGTTSQEVSFPVSISVSPGTYAVVFGSGLFGSPVTAEGYMPDGPLAGNVVQPGANLFTWSANAPPLVFANARWFDTGNQGERFVVEGTVPEPSSILLVGFGLITLVAFCRKGKISQRSPRREQNRSR